MLNATPNFWGFFRKVDDQLRQDFARVANERDLHAVMAKWRDPVHGTLSRVMNDPIFMFARRLHQRTMMDYIQNRLRLEEIHARNLWRLPV